jgi:predicted nucleotidyltransferase
MLAELMTSDSRAEIMRILFNGTGEEHYLREMEKMSHIKVNSLQKEVKHLESIDLIKSRKDGNRIYYRANKDHPIYTELVSIVEKTVGITSLLVEKLKDQRIKCVFIFGSIARNEEKAMSDIDLVVIGDIGLRSVSKLLSGLQELIGREINPHVYSDEEFRQKVSQKNHFVMSILKNEIKPILGNVNEYR